MTVIRIDPPLQVTVHARVGLAHGLFAAAAVPLPFKAKLVTIEPGPDIWDQHRARAVVVEERGRVLVCALADTHVVEP